MSRSETWSETTCRFCNQRHVGGDLLIESMKVLDFEPAMIEARSTVSLRIATLITTLTFVANPLLLLTPSALALPATESSVVSSEWNHLYTAGNQCGRGEGKRHAES